MHDVIVIGAGTAGLTAALYVRRAGKTVLVLERENFGGQITYSPRVENYPGISRISGQEFASALFEQAAEAGAEMEMERVTGVFPVEGARGEASGREAGVNWQVVTEEGRHLAKSVIVAAGAGPRRLGLAGEEELTGRGISYCALCDGAFYRDQEVAVAGGGNTALQDALFLADCCRRVYLIHRRNTFRGESRWVELLEQRENVEFFLDTEITGLEREGPGEKEQVFLWETVKEAGEASLKALALRCGKEKAARRLAVAGLFVAVGQEPANQAFAGLLPLDQAGYIIAGEDCRTPAPGIFAAGDCRTKEVRQLTTAAADGAVAATAACRWCDEHS